MQLVWATVTGTPAGNYVNFPDQPELRTGVKVIGIEAWSDTYITATPDNVTVISAADAVKLTFNFYEGAVMRLRQVPFASLAPGLNSGIWRETEPFLVNWQKSQVYVNNALSTAAARTVPLVVHYFKG